MNSSSREHISVCICTYKRPQMLAHLLDELQHQKTDNLFTYSIVVVDNDSAQSAKSVVNAFQAGSIIRTEYYTEPDQNIALARNKAVSNANGDLLAFIDDDEFPTNTWLINLYKTLCNYSVDGVLGPVLPYFEAKPPQWIIKGQIFERPSHQTGCVLSWRYTRTGNVMLRKYIFHNAKNLFNHEFGSGGEDRDFFKRMIDHGYIFIWCSEAPVHEVVPPERWSRIFMLKRALLRGKVSFFHPASTIFDVFKSFIAVILYTPALPFLLLMRHHVFMQYLIKDFDHIGKILAACGVNVLRQKYIVK